MKRKALYINIATILLVFILFIIIYTSSPTCQRIQVQYHPDYGCEIDTLECGPFGEFGYCVSKGFDLMCGETENLGNSHSTDIACEDTNLEITCTCTDEDNQIIEY